MAITMKNRPLFWLVFVMAVFMITLNFVFTSTHLSRKPSDLHSLQTIEHAMIRAAVNPIYSNNVCLNRYQHKEYTLSNEEKKRLGSYKYFIVANLKNSEGIFDYFLSELIQTIKLLISLTDDPSSIFVSIFESSSVDITPIALQSFEVVLEAMGVSHDITSDANFKRKSNVRITSLFINEKQPRIEFLANVRNRAMEPLFSPLVPNFDRIIYFNDIYFCKNDILRLLLYDADMACAMDFDAGFRDTWVMRTIDGNLLGKWAPDYDISHSESLERLKQGKAFHVLSAWNGLAIMKSTAFYRGVKFHDGKTTTCPTSECALLCLDMWKNNLTRIIVDPRVLVAYDYLDFERLNNKYETPMVDLDLKVPYFPMPESWQCCPIYGLNFDGLREDCKWQSLSEWRPK